MRKSAVSAVGVACAVLLGMTTPATAGTSQHPPAAIDWQPCPTAAGNAVLRCATIQVPVDWGHPHGPTIPLAVAEHLATDPAARIGTLVIHPGGPGVSGVRFITTADTRLSPEILRRFDVVGFDPRGVAGSHPVVCSTSVLAEQPFPIPTDQREFDGLVAYNRKAFSDCRARTGHTMYQRTPCTRAYVDRYLINLAVPAKGATCPPA